MIDSLGSHSRMSRGDRGGSETATGAATGLRTDGGVAVSQGRSGAAMFGVLAAFLAAGLGGGITLVIYDAVAESSSAFGIDFWAASLSFVAPLLGTGLGFWAGRYLDGDSGAYAASVVGGAVGYVLYFAALYVSMGVVQEFTEIEFVERLGIAVGVAVAAVLGAVAASLADEL